MAADTFNRRQGDWYYQDSLDSYKAGFSFEEVEEIIARSDLKSVRHVQPLLNNLFQCFYISSTDNVASHRVTSLRHLWQKADYFLLELLFPALPLAKGEIVHWDAHRPPARKQSSRIRNSDVIEILEIGTRAMSVYNIQPWRFRVDGDQIFVHFVRHKNFYFKLEGVYYLMIGHLLENIRAGARSKGYRAEYEILSDALSIDEPCLKLRLIDVHGPRETIAHILDRTTNRYAYSTRKLPESVKEDLLGLCANENIKLCINEDGEEDRLSAILARMEGVRLRNSKLVQELMHFIDLDIQQNQRYRDHLDVGTFGFNSLGKALMRRTKDFPALFGFFKITGVLELFIRLFARPKKLYVQSGALLSFFLKQRGYKDYIDLGVLIQAVANKLAEYQLASMSVISGLYLIDALHENPEILSRQAKREIERAALELGQRLPAGWQRLSFVMRAGYPDRIPPKTVRKNILDLIYRADQKIEF